MKIIKNIVEKIKKLDGNFGLILKSYLIISLIIIIMLFVINIYYFGLLSKINITVFDRSITDVVILDQILVIFEEENINYSVTPNGILLVDNNKIAKRMRIKLTEENLVPSESDPWIIFDRYRRNYTEFEQNINLQRARQMMINHQIRAIDGVLDTGILIVWADENYPFTNVSLRITPKPESDITRNRRKIEGIQEYLLNSISGLQLQNIVIIDNNGLIINEFEDNIE